MQIDRVRCLPDRRPEGAGISPEVQMFLFLMQQQGFVFELRADGRGVLDGPRRI